MTRLGCYLSPEPLLQDPLYPKEEALEGRSVPTYAYAFNNPLYFVDPDGLSGTGTAHEWAEKAKRWCDANPSQCRRTPAMDPKDPGGGECKQPKANNLAECLEACKGTTEKMEDYCRSLSGKKERALCWAAIYLGQAACISFCSQVFK